MNTPYLVVVRERDFPEVIYDVMGFASWEIAVAVANKTSTDPNVIAEVKAASVH